MPLDPSIPLSVRPFQGVNILAIQENQRRQEQEARLAEQDKFEQEKYRAARQELADQQAEKKAFGEAYQNAGGNRQELLNQLAQRGLGHKIPDVIEQFNKIDKGSLELDEIQARTEELKRKREDAQTQGVGQIGALIESLGNDQNAWETGRQIIRDSNGKWGSEEQLTPFDATIASDPSKIPAITAVMQKKAQAKAPTGKTRLITTPNPETGEPEQRIVADEPGQSFPIVPKAQQEALEGTVPVVRVNPRTGKVETLGEVPKGSHFVQEPAPPAASGGGNAANDVRTAVAAMKEGTVPPQLPGRASKDYLAVLAESKRQGFDLAKAAEDWQATSRYLGTLNGAQQVRLRQAVSFTKDSLGLIEDMAKQWDAGRFPLLNKGNLALAKSGAMGQAAQSLATRMEAQISDLTSELGTVYKGGNSSTDESLKLAAQNLRSDWSKKTMLDNIQQIRKNLEIREHSMSFGAPAGTGENPYFNQNNQAPPAGGGGQVTGKVGKYTYTVK